MCLVFIIEICFVIWLINKTPVVYDHFFVRREMKRVLPFVILLCVFYIISNVVTYLHYHSNVFESEYYAIIPISYDLITHILYLMIIYYSTQWVIIRLKPMMITIELKNKNSEKDYYFNKIISSRTETPSMSVQLLMGNTVNVFSGINRSDHKYGTLRQVLQDSTAIELFMQHLSKEFSMECLLALIECTQFIQLIIAHDSTILEKNNIICHNSNILKNNKLSNSFNSKDWGLGVVSNKSTAARKKKKNSQEILPIAEEKAEENNNNNSNSNNNNNNNNNNSSNNDPKYDNTLLLIEFPMTIAQSLIVFNNDEIMSDGDDINSIRQRCEMYHNIGNKLSDKYIFSNSEYEVNIDSRLKKDFVKHFHIFSQLDLNMLQQQSIEEMFVNIVCLFNQCNLSNFCLMQDAFNRFQKTKRYKKLIKSKKK